MNEEKPVQLDVLARPFPREAIKQREGAGGKRFDYVQTQTVARRLNEATDNRWDFRVTRVEWRGDLLITHGELTLPGLGTRTGTGVQKVSERGGEDLIKGSASDALKNAARLFGVGIDLYGEDYEDEAYQQPTQASKPQRAPQQRTQAAAQMPQKAAERPQERRKLNDGDPLSQEAEAKLIDHARRCQVPWNVVEAQARAVLELAPDAPLVLTAKLGRDLWHWIEDEQFARAEL